MVKIFKYIEWLLKFCPSVKYTGYYCKHCDKWHDVPFEIPTYKSYGFFYDTYVTAYPNGCQPVEVKPKNVFSSVMNMVAKNLYVLIISTQFVHLLLLTLFFVLFVRRLQN